MGESSLIHLGMVKMRITGHGSCALAVQTFDDLNQVDFPWFTLSPTSARLQQRLTNYTAQGIAFIGSTKDIGDSFVIQDITLFFKQIYNEYPQ